MYLLPILSPAARLLTRLYHRLTVAGGRVPASGPVLVVANHPNSLIDPAVVVGVARRPVRFLAKHTLFAGEAVSWIVRGAGSIPVYRQSDAAGMMHRNEDAFRAVYEALAGGSAVGIFPEGISHSGSALAPLKTGAARIALGAAERLGRPFPIIPVGLTFERRDTFRSTGLVLVGSPIPWDGLEGSPAEDAAAIRTLTERIEKGLRRVTVNLERWEDAPLVHTAEGVFAAETGAPDDPHERILRLKTITEGLQRLRRSGDGGWTSLARDLERHDRLLRRLRLRPSDLRARPGVGAVARWTGRNVPFLGLFGLVLVALGSALFWPPYRAVGLIADRVRVSEDLRSTYKLVAGMVLFTLWWVVLVALGALLSGWEMALALALGTPLLGLLTLELQARWELALEEARRFAVLRLRPERVRQLGERQRDLAARLVELERTTREAGGA